MIWTFDFVQIPCGINLRLRISVRVYNPRNNNFRRILGPFSSPKIVMSTIRCIHHPFARILFIKTISMVGNNNRITIQNNRRRKGSGPHFVSFFRENHLSRIFVQIITKYIWFCIISYCYRIRKSILYLRFDLSHWSKLIPISRKFHILIKIRHVRGLRISKQILIVYIIEIIHTRNRPGYHPTGIQSPSHTGPAGLGGNPDSRCMIRQRNRNGQTSAFDLVQRNLDLRYSRIMAYGNSTVNTQRCSRRRRRNLPGNLQTIKRVVTL